MFDIMFIKIVFGYTTSHFLSLNNDLFIKYFLLYVINTYDPWINLNRNKTQKMCRGKNKS